MHYLHLVGRMLFSLIFITAAPRHFTSKGSQHAADLGVPLASLLVPLSGVMAFAGGLSIAIGYDLVVPLKRRAPSFQVFPNHRLEVFEGGHAAFLEDPGRFEPVLRGFLNQVCPV